jgi:MFS family permease
MFACFTVYFFILQPLAVEMGIQEGGLGYLYAIYMTGSVAGALILARISKKCGEILILLFCFVMAATGFFTISLDLGIVGLACGMVQFSFGYGGSIPVLYAFANTFIPSPIRASTSSLMGTIGTGGIIVLQILMGVFIESHGLVAASLCAVIFAAAGICALLVLYNSTLTV